MVGEASVDELVIGTHYCCTTTWSHELKNKYIQNILTHCIN